MSALLHVLSKDDVNVQALERVYRAYGSSPEFLDDALSAMRQLDIELAWRALWLLNRAGRDRALPEATLAKVAAYVDELAGWAARLCACQLFAAHPCPYASRETLFPFLSECFADRRVILRAWALSALRHFCDDAKFARHYSVMLSHARDDPAASMKARLRHLEPAASKRRRGS
jgi:hypothetical protein